MRRVGVCGAWLLAVLVLAPPAASQAAGNESGGLLLSGGVGAGWTRLSCAICRRDREFGPTAQFGAATRVNPQLLVGAEAAGWVQSVPDEDFREYVGALQGVAYLYPRRRSAVYVKGGLGWVTYRADDVSTNGIGMQLGAGYELAVGGGLALNNYIGLTTSSFTSLKRDGNTVADDVSVTLLRLGVGIRRR